MPAQNRQSSPRNQRDQRAQSAKQHVATMEKRFSAEIARSKEGIVRFDSLKAAKAAADKAQAQNAAEKNAPHLTFLRADSVQAVLEHGRGIASQCDLTVLDFASFTHPAGNFEQGFFGQEQALCAASTLANVLKTQTSWYKQNQTSNVNCELYKNRALIVPKVRFERDNYHSYADVLVVAAPNAVRATSQYHIDAATQFSYLKDRMQFMLACAAASKKPKLVLGAWGTGAFGWDAQTVATALFEALIASPYTLEQVILAVPQQRNNEHDDIFEHVFAHFPTANPDPYLCREEREHQAQIAQRSYQADQPDDDEDEEEDWRKYL